MPMTDKLIFNTCVTYGDVDRREIMLLPRVFKLLQEVAIRHANQFGTGTDALATRAETWVLNRIAATIQRYPRVDDELRVETWSSGIRGFKGLRDFRVYDGSGAVVVVASSLWLYISVRAKAITRVPRDIADTFPVCHDPVAFPELDKLPFESPGVGAAVVPVTLRYSDFDINEHVNNAAYFDLLQSALAQSGGPAMPRTVRLKYAKAIPAEARQVDVRLEPQADGVRFSMEGDGLEYAVGAAAG